MVDVLSGQVVTDPSGAPTLIGSISGPIVSIDRWVTVRFMHRTTAVITMIACGTGISGYVTRTFIDPRGVVWLIDKWMRGNPLPAGGLPRKRSPLVSSAIKGIWQKTPDTGRESFFSASGFSF